MGNFEKDSRRSQTGRFIFQKKSDIQFVINATNPGTI